MLTFDEASKAMEIMGAILRGEYVPPPKPKADKCAYCAKDKDKCGCGASR